MEEEPLLKIGEAARLCGVSVDTMRRWANSGRVSVIVLPSRQRRFTLEALAEIVTPAEERHERAYERRTA